MPSLSFDNVYNINASRNEPVHSQEKSHLRLKWIKGRNVKVGQFCSELHQSWVREKAKWWSSMTKDRNDAALPFQCFSGVSLQTWGSEPHIHPNHGFRQSLPLAQLLANIHSITSLWGILGGIFTPSERLWNYFETKLPLRSSLSLYFFVSEKNNSIVF